MPNKKDSQYLSITELVRLLDLTLQEYVGELVFTGEVHQVTYAQSGHVYFSLKDEDGKIDAVMWAGLARALKLKIEPGLAVVCQGRPNVYQRSGKLQMIVNRLELFGEGLLQKKFNELKERLEKEGLFDPSRKRQLPFLPKAVGIVTSRDGAVIHDIMHRIQARMPNLQTFLIDTRVQGQGAAEEIVKAIKHFNNLNKVDVLIVARGGGSLEDLWAFNEEPVVRAIFASRIPVVSAVGHETDFTLADFVADLRAPTPTAAAELVVPSRKELEQTLLAIERRLAASDRWLQPAWQALDELSVRFQAARNQLQSSWALLIHQVEAQLRRLEPRNLIGLFNERLALLKQRLTSTFQNQLALNKQALNGLAVHLTTVKPLKQVELQRRQLEQLQQRLILGSGTKFNLTNSKLAEMANRLEALNHIKLLKRGYAVVQSDGRLIDSVDLLETGDKIVVSVSDGSINAEVQDLKVGELWKSN